MSWLGLLLIGFGVTDLVFSLLVVTGRSARVVPECVGAAASVLAALLAGMTSGRDVAALVLVVAAVVAWGQTVTLGFRDGRPLVPLAVLAGSVVAAIVLNPFNDPTAGPLQDWLVERIDDGPSLSMLA